MPDTRKTRGPHPKDERCFGALEIPTLRRAVDELSWLLSKGYSRKAAQKLVGDRHKLRDRQRKAIQRCAASDESCRSRLSRRLDPGELRGRELWIDGYNVLLTVEAAMDGAVVLGARDEAFRDIAAMSRHYRSVDATVPALRALGATLDIFGCSKVVWLLDRPISNSGRLRALMLAEAGHHDWPWDVRLVDNPDAELRGGDQIVATADSGILDRCGSWLNLARLAVERHAPQSWVVDLSRPSEPKSAVSEADSG